ncbi:hypothetical protein L6164_037463 [Bauhinia variegata]|uniref:Uncharacterized protein n=1 Tax=Bauhinia variegata TaxID=167791 RepID=A0ACB9KK35_BAUVA|nr:hypothetical protein L6164_037463 [Bauhinia variegata]
MTAEYDALCTNQTWDLVPRDGSQNLVGCKWIYRIKYHLDGSLDWYKAHLVAKGFHQRPGWDYSAMFSPMVKLVIVRLVLALAVSLGWCIRQLDINNAFILDVIYLLVYVDDIIIIGSPQQQVLQVIQQLATRFSLKDLGNLSYFLGVKVDPHLQGLFLSQRKYILDILSRAQMAESKAISTPMCATTTLIRYSGESLVSLTEYRTLAGSLQYLSLTRPDVAFTVHRLSQFMHAPTTTHWNALKRLLRYLASTVHHGIVVHKSSPFILHGYSDADWAGDKDDYVSTTGYLLYMG